MSSRQFRKLMASVLGAGLAVGFLGVMPAQADTNVPIPLQVNFQAQTTTSTPAGYLSDFGQAYSATQGYGWIDANGAPLSLVGNGRERDVQADQRLDTLMQMQLNPGSAGVATPGAWKASIANGTYQVTVASGDPSYIDSHNVIQVEGSTAIDFTPTTATPQLTNTITVTVTDGFLNVDALGGANTKINYLTAVPSSTTNPYVTAVTPVNGATGINIDAAVTAQLSTGVDPTTANAAGFQIFQGTTQLTGHYNVDGAYSNVTFQPTANFAANTTYTVKVTSALKDPSGAAYTPFTSSFTTGAGTTVTPSTATFTRSVFDFSDGTAATSTAYKTAGPTALALGPNPASPKQLWVAYGTGAIHVYNLDPATGKKTGAPSVVNTFNFNRVVAGLRFDPASTDANIKLWVSNGQFGCDLAAMGTACTDFTGAISTLTGTSVAGLVKADIVTGLPRSVGNHMNNGIDFGPDGALYVAQGSHTGYGSPDPIWGNRAEVPLAAAVLKVDVAAITAGGLAPYSVNTSTGYNPKLSTSRVTTYATGTRNPFSVLWHSNGKLYSPVNESASGNTPADATNGGSPAALSGLPAFNDYFTQIVAGKYYGHPNPTRSEYRLNGGNPTSGVDPFEVPQYPVGTAPNSNWRAPDMDLGQHRSANGSTEFKSSVFGSALQGQILVTEYSQGKDVIAIKLDAAGKAVSRSVIATNFYNPLPIITDAATGRVYVGEYGSDPDGAGGLLSILTPSTTTPPPAAALRVNFQAETTVTPSGYSADSGQAFDATRGYGWQTATGGTLSMVGNGRERGVQADKRLDTFMQMQLKAGSAGVTTPGRWEAVVPNGTYTMTVAVGDPSYTDSHNILNVEGTKVVDYIPTTAAPQSTVTSQVTVADGRLTIDPTGGTNTKINYVDLVASTTPPPPADTTAPTVTVTPSGTKNAAGDYVGSASVTIAATDAGSGVKTRSYTLDGGAAQAYTAPFTVGTVGSHTVVATATDNAGNASAPVTSTFTVAAGTPPPTGSAKLAVASPEDALGVGSRLVFSTVKNEARPGHNLTVSNTGTSALTVSGLAFGGARAADFQLCAGQAATFTVAAGANAPVCVMYRPTVNAITSGIQLSQATLTISSNDTAQPQFVVTLGGVNIPEYENTNEPNLKQVFDILGYKVDPGVTNKPIEDSIGGASAAIGDEVLAPYFKKLDTAKPVSMIPLAHYAGKSAESSVSFGWYARGSATNNFLYAFPGGTANNGYGQNQLLLPTTTQPTLTFNPTGSFGFVDGGGNKSDDALNFGDQKLHNVRMYPAKNAAGVAIPGAWLVADDKGGPVNTTSKNWDYQDFVFLLTNVQPDTTVQQPAGGLDSKTLAKFLGTAGGVDGSGFPTSMGVVDVNKINYLNEQLRITTSDDSKTVHTNALQLAVNATTATRIQSTLVGPFDAINAGGERQGIFWGVDSNNHFKAEVQWRASDSTRRLTFWRMVDGVSSSVASVPLPGGNAAKVDIRITLEPSPANDGPPLATMWYAMNGSTTFVRVGSQGAVTIPSTWIRSLTYAGIVNSHQSGGAPFTARYGNFQAVRNY